jgi:PilZ domain
LGEDNGGMVLNISEAGLALQAAITLADEDLPLIRFQLPPSKKIVEASGRITWVSPTGKEVGVAFVNLSEDVRAQINKWIILDSTRGGLQEQEEAELAPPAEEKIVEEQEQAAVNASEASPISPSAPATSPETLLTPEEPIAPPPETVSPALPTSVPTRRRQASPQMGPATFGSFGRSKPDAPLENFAAPATATPAAIPAKVEQSAALAYPAPIIAPALDTGRGPRPPRESAFSLREPAQIHREALGKRRWWAFGGAVVSLAAVSFAMGMLAGRGDFGAFAEIFGRDNVVARASTGTTGPTSANSDSTERSSPSGKITDEPANNSAATPQDQRALLRS